MPSARHQRLVTNLGILRAELLPRNLATVSVRAPWHGRALAYRVLAHAEFEAYFEDRARDAVNAALQAWRSTAVVGRVLLGVMAFCEREVSPTPATLLPPHSNKAKAWPELVDIDARLTSCVTRFHRLLLENHGVKEANILSLLLPIGFPVSALDPLWLSQMTSFGSARGATAHSARVQQLVDPRSELLQVQQLLSQIAIIDLELDRLT